MAAGRQYSLHAARQRTFVVIAAREVSDGKLEGAHRPPSL